MRHHQAPEAQLLRRYGDGANCAKRRLFQSIGSVTQRWETWARGELCASDVWDDDAMCYGEARTHSDKHLDVESGALRRTRTRTPCSVPLPLPCTLKPRHTFNRPLLTGSPPTVKPSLDLAQGHTAARAWRHDFTAP